MTDPSTNRELYLALGELAAQHQSTDRSLEEYLLALVSLAQKHRDQSSLSSGEFYRLLADAFTAEPLTFDPAWAQQYDSLVGDQPGFRGWMGTVLGQIVDLHEMAESGALANEYRYFGLTAPRGGSWFNFDPVGYIECACAGSLGGWEPGDDTGRQFVPGPCAVMDSTGDIQTANPEDVERPIVEVSVISWELFRNFVECGRMYE